ncbi:MAG: hypothetical protein M3Q29_20845 [Chloroflexota bacterium]|nr:hypothetical protein [Chloroflexota bacterium]
MERWATDATVRAGAALPTIGAKELAAATQEVIGSLRDGMVSESAYDTAVVSGLRSSRDPSRPAYPDTISWLRRRQHSDGSWGGRIELAHDRVISTLAAVVHLEDVPDGWAQSAVRDGVGYLWKNIHHLETSPSETIAFELLVPQLLGDARRLGLRLPYQRFTDIEALREEKLRQAPLDDLYRHPTTLAHSLEFLGNDIDSRQVHRLRERNGSYGNSPSATAHVLAHIRDDQAEAYLSRVVGVSLNGGVPTTYPIDVFERAWILYNLGAANARVRGVSSHLRYLATALTSEGVGWSLGIVPDSDDTAITLIALAHAGSRVDMDVLLRFEHDRHFSCFPFERNTSVSANAHVLEALKLGQSQRPGRYTEQITKITSYLQEHKSDGGYWLDKWHASPYYATAQVARAAHDGANDLLAGTHAWLLETQKPDGSWGWYVSTSEETAYAMQSLLLLSRYSDPFTAQALDRAAAYLTARFHDTDYRELWIGKGLYTPYNVVRSAVISALLLYRQERGTRA